MREGDGQVYKNSRAPRIHTRTDGLLMVERPALRRKFETAVKRPITLVTAPVGFGKRTLIHDWRESLSPTQRVRTFDGDSTELLALLEDPTDVDFLVVQDAASLPEGRLERLVAVANQGIHVVLCSEVSPRLSIGSLSAQGKLTEFRSTDLAFTADEVNALLHARRPDTPTWVEERVMEMTWGWPAAMRIITLYDLSWDRVGHLNGIIAQFVEDQILSRLDADEQAFLRTLSVVPEVTAGLAQTLSGRTDHFRLLAELQAKGVPVYWGEHSARLHPLVRDTLLAHARRDDPEQVRELTRRAARWLRHERRALSAIEVALDADDPALVGDFLRQEFLREFLREPRRLRGLVERAAAMEAIQPWEAAGMQTMLLGAHLESSQSVAVSSVLALLPEQLSRHEQVWWAAFRFFMARQDAYQGTNVSDLVQLAEDTHDEPGQRLSTEALAALAWLRLEYGCWLAAEGTLDRASTWLVRATTTSRLADLPYCTIQSLAATAWVAAERGTIHTSRQVAAEALLEAQDHLGTDRVPLTELAWLAHALVDAESGDTDAAEHHLELYQQCSPHERRETRVRAGFVRAMAQLIGRDPAAAVATLGSVRAGNDALLPYEEFALTATLAAALCGLNRLDEAERELDRLDVLWRPGFVPPALTRAHYLNFCGRCEEAFRLLQPLFDERGIRSEKEWLQLLVAYGLAAEGSGRPELAKRSLTEAEVLARRLGLDQPAARHNLPRRLEPQSIHFTEAELNVLRRLAPRQTTAELAAELFISVNTVKTHLRRIYRKLGVTTKAEALRRAERMRLLREPERRPS